MELEFQNFQHLVDTEVFPGEVVMKTSNKEPDSPITKSILSIANDLKELEFYHEFAELEGTELIQGSYFMDRPHYEKKEQIVCSVEGKAFIEMVPHVKKQEVYAGKITEQSLYHDPANTLDSEANVSPINFFTPDKKLFPNFENANPRMVTLNKGDCMFIPAYYFY
jgi:hypothetical protein